MNNITRNPDGKPPRVGFRLDKTNGKVFGVCSGIADYAGIDTMLVRVGFVVGALVSFGTAALIYLAIALIAD
jgi:phage shock protein PspC (stress-responsive transcriptional regulator)